MKISNLNGISDNDAPSHEEVRPRFALAGATVVIWLAMVIAPSSASATTPVQVLTDADGHRVLHNPEQQDVSVRSAPAPPVSRSSLPATNVASPESSGVSAAPSAPPAAVRFATLTTVAPVLAAELDLAAIVAKHAADYGLDPALVRAVIRAESAGNRRAVSRVGAMGLMQLMPGTAAELAVADPWDAADNVRGGSAYLAQMIERFDRLDLALAAYNAGPAAVERYAAVPPYPETVAYVRRVLSLYHGRDVALSELRVASGDRAPAGRAGSPVLLRDGSGRTLLTNTTAHH